MRYQEIFLTILVLKFFSFEVEAYSPPTNERKAFSSYDTDMLAELISSSTNFKEVNERLITINNQMEEMQNKLKTESSSIAEKFAIIQKAMNTQSSTENKTMTELPEQEEFVSINEKMISIDGGLNKTQMFQQKLEELEILRSERLQTRSHFLDIEKRMLSTKIAFFAQRNSSYGVPGSMIPYTNCRVNLGGSLNQATGIFTVPVTGVYHFHFTALKTKKENCGSSRLTVQLILLGTPTRMLAEGHLNSNDWYSWLPVQLQATVLLQKKNLVGIQLLEGTIHENGEPSHLTGFIGFLVNQIA